MASDQAQGLEQLGCLRSIIGAEEPKLWGKDHYPVLGLDRRAARYTWTVVFVFLLLGLVYLIRETLFIFAVALLFA